MTGKTLKELDVKPGDVVRYDGSFGDAVTAYIIAGWDDDRCYHTRQVMGGGTSMNSAACWSIIARATPPSDAEPVTSGSPKPMRDMTDAEIGALVRAKAEGKDIQARIGESWMKVADRPCWSMGLAYRIKPEPKRETVTLHWDHESGCAMDTMMGCDTHRVTFDLIDGKPDCASIRMEELP